MGLRQTIDENRGVALSVSAGLIIVTFAIIGWFSFSSHSSSSDLPGEKAFFTDDDGKTFFVDQATNIPPFTRNGKTAVGCNVFTSDHGKTKFVGSLLRFTDEGKRRFEQMHQAKGKGGGFGPNPFDCVEVKKPGAPETAWVKATLPAGVEIQRPPKVSGVMAQPVFAE